MAGPQGIPPTHPLFREVMARAFDADVRLALKAARGTRLLPQERQKALNAAAFAGWSTVMRQIADALQKELRLNPFERRLNMCWALTWAARGGSVEAMREAKKQDAEDVNSALANAAYGGHLDAMELAWKWGAMDVERALIEAAEAGQVEAMRLAKKWGARKYGDALVKANGEAWALLVAWRAER